MTATRELRADAQRNLGRVLDAAREVFAEQGLDAHVTEIADRAGVGVGTIFRRFPTKDALLAALLEQRGRELLDRAAALAGAEPGDAFEGLVTAAVELQIRDRGFCDAIGTQVFGREELHELFHEVHGHLRRLLAAAQAAGAVRDDVTAEDVALILHGIARTGLMLEPAAPGAWRRYLRLALDGLRPDSATALPRKPPSRRQFEAARTGCRTRG